ncbi:MAG TPA: hypothetical protein DDX91_07480 [Ruminococcaceae bacterium]|nr:hypothetical protein [Oscillospiraceae bacterium]
MQIFVHIFVHIFVNNFVACRAKFCRNIVIFQKILTKQAAKFAEKMHAELCVNTLSFCCTGFCLLLSKVMGIYAHF